MGGGGRGLKEIGLYVFRFENGCTPVSIKSWVGFLGCLVDSTSSDKSSSDAVAAATLRTGLPDLLSTFVRCLSSFQLSRSWRLTKKFERFDDSCLRLSVCLFSACESRDSFGRCLTRCSRIRKNTCICIDRSFERSFFETSRRFARLCCRGFMHDINLALMKRC